MERKIARAAKKHQEFLRKNPEIANQEYSARREKASWDTITALMEDYREIMVKYIDAQQQLDQAIAERDALLKVLTKVRTYTKE